jgi:plasmid stabilization system protein ParE
MRLQVLDAARDDLIAGFDFYEARERGGVGDHFLACLYSDVESLRIFGGIHRRVYKNLQRSLSKRFPFAIYYTVENDAVIVRAILDCMRNPSWIRSRLRNA